MIGSRRAFDGKLVHLRVDDVRLPSGRETRREIVEHPGSVAILALTDEGEVILVRQWRHAAGRRLLEVPAGTREPGEPAIETARRELLEETGHAAREIVELISFFPTAGYSDERMTLFRATGCVPVDREPDVDEPTEVVRVQLADIPHLLAPGPEQLADAAVILALLWALHPPA